MSKGAMKEITCWPDVKPTFWGKNVGKKAREHLTWVHPVYRVYYPLSNRTDWHWLMLCDCGEEIILSASTNRKSCGCFHRAEKEKKKAKKEEMEMPIENRFNRGSICVRGDFSCVHYRECQEERIDTDMGSARYRKNAGSCYQASERETRIMPHCPG